MGKHEGRSGMVGNTHGSRPYKSMMHPNKDGRMTGRSGMPGTKDSSKPINLLGKKGIQVPQDMAAKVHNKFQHKSK